MDNFQMTQIPVTVDNKEYKSSSNLYLRRTPAKNEVEVTKSDADTGLGVIAVNNWEIYDGVGPSAAIVARAQGLHIHAGNWSNVFSIVFESSSSFSGSTLEVMGVDSGELAIVGGTGKFGMARGVIYKQSTSDGSIFQLTIRGFFPALKEVQPPPPPPPVNRTRPVKIGTYGGNGGREFDIQPGDTPTRLESITIRYYGVIDAIEFSYINQSGQKRTIQAGGTGAQRTQTIQLGPSDFVKEVKGLIGTYNGYTVIRTLEIVTNRGTYGPYGNSSMRVTGSYSIPVQKSSIVGFFGRGHQFLDAIGVYVKDETQ